MTVKKIINGENRKIVYDWFFVPKRPCVVYLHGLNSSRRSEKGKRLLAFAKAENYAFFSVDYTAHGESEGVPSDFRIGRCLDDVLTVIAKEKITNPLYLAGSSLGGWIAFLLAEKMPEQVKGVLTLAAGVDFLDYVWKKLLPGNVKALLKSGAVIGPSPATKGYCFSYPMFTEARPYFMLNRQISYAGPAVLVHGDKDTTVLPANSFKIKNALMSNDVQIHIVKGEGHSLSSYPMEETLKLLIQKGEEK